MATLNETMTRLLNTSDGIYSAAVAAMANASDYTGIANWFNARPLINNPEPQGTVPKPVKNIFEITNLLAGPAEVATFTANVELLKLQPYLSGLVQFETSADINELCDSTQGLSDESKDAIKALCAQTILDPSYQAQIPGPARHEIYEVPGPVNAAQIQNFFNQ